MKLHIYKFENKWHLLEGEKTKCGKELPLNYDKRVIGGGKYLGRDPDPDIKECCGKCFDFMSEYKK